MATSEILKRSSLGDLLRSSHAGRPAAVRALGAARFGCLWLARHLARREARALTRLEGVVGVPELIALDRDRLVRSYLDGEAMHRALPRSRAYFRHTLRLLRQIHRHGVAHNDLAKEANWICGPGQTAGIVDFQLAYCPARRTRWFRLLAREDLRHWLKHKAHYRPDTLTDRQQKLLATPAWPARLWRIAVKPLYRLLTRRLLGWPERFGAAERERQGADERQRPA
jgi:RIO-like serine/threonine protein kinase